MRETGAAREDEVPARVFRLPDSFLTGNCLAACLLWGVYGAVHLVQAMLRHYALALLFIAPGALAQVPTFGEVAGHAIGERIIQTHQVERYLERLAEASDRVTFEVIGQSWQGRPLMMAVVTSPENHARIAEIKRNAQRLGDPRGLTAAEEAAIIQTQPVVIWFGGAIHGFELSGTEGLLMLLEHLTTRDDAETLDILRNAVVLIDPVLNPDGRDAFAQHNHHRLGAEQNPSLADWGNDFTSWEALSFRTGHYFFDHNRDWFAHTQAETLPRVEAIRAWHPQVGVDAHEMGHDVEFFIDPPADPIAKYTPEFALRWFERFGRAHAEAFDRAGVDYMTGERFDYFYPGYLTAFLTFQGAVGLLYEQGSSRGLAIERPDGTVRTLETAARQQFIAALAATRLAVRERQALLRDYVAELRAAIDDGQRGVRRYLITTASNPQLAADLAALLVRNGIEVRRLTEGVTLSGVTDRTGQAVGNRSFPAGTFVVEAAQPRNRFIRTLLEPDIPMPQDFVEQARHRLDRGESPRFYDLTAWSLPLMFNVEVYSARDGRSLASAAFTGEVAAPPPPPREAGFAYLIDGRQTAVPAALYHIRGRGHRVAMLTRPTRIQGVDFASGTGIVYVGATPGVHPDVREVARDFGLALHAVDTGLAEPGHPSLGSGYVIYLRQPRIAILAEEPVHAYSFGWAWYTLDRQYSLRPTVIRARSLGTVPLSDFDVLVLPATTDTTTIPRERLDRLARWVREGGTLVTLGAATELARGPLGLIALRPWTAEDEAPVRRFTVPGSFARADVDPDAWLTAGYDAELPVLVFSDRVYLPPEGPPSARQRTPVRYAAADIRMAGHFWSESLERLAGAVFLYEERVGRGRVIAFAEDPNFRAYWRGADRLFLNAVVFGPNAP